MRDDIRRPDELPIACSLGATEGAARLARWRGLSDARLDMRHEAGEMVVLYASRRGVQEELEALVAAERVCCAFAEWDITRDAENIVLRVRADAPGLAAIIGASGR